MGQTPHLWQDSVSLARRNETQERHAGVYRRDEEIAGSTANEPNQILRHSPGGSDEDQMNALVTGATGFIGRALIKRLLVEGHEVNYLARQRSRKVDMRAAFHFWQPGERPPLNSVPRLDAIVH